MGGATEHFGETAGLYDSGKAPGLQVVDAGANFGMNLASAGFLAKDIGTVALRGGQMGLAKLAAGDAAGSGTLSRDIRATEDPAAGLIAKDPSAAYSAHAHVASGGRLSTQYISTTKSAAVAQYYATRDGLRVVAIDTGKLGGATMIDLTDPAVAQRLLRHPIPRNFAAASQEVLIQGLIPPEALQVIHQP